MRLSSKEVDALLQAFILGTGRGGGPPLPAAIRDAAPAGSTPEELQLAALALAGQRERFVRRWPAVPRPDVVPAEADAWVPDDLRQAVWSLLAVASVAEAKERPLIPRLLRLLRRHGRRLHPFDLPRFEAAAKAWPALVDPADLVALGITDRALEVSEDNWLSVTPVQRQEWFATLRRTDPEAARALVERDLAGAPAKVRGQVVPLMAWRLSGDDRPWLESMRKDRSSTVRESVHRLLARIPGTHEEAVVCEVVADHFKYTRRLLSRKRLSYQNKLDDSADALSDTWGLRLTALADALAMPEATSKWPKLSQEVAAAFAFAALHEGDLDRFAWLFGEVDGYGWGALLAALGEHGEQSVAPGVLAGALRRLHLGRLEPGGGALEVLQSVFPDALPDDLGRRLLDERTPNALVQDAEATLLLLPPSCLERAARLLSRAPSGPVQAWLEIVKKIGPSPDVAADPE